MVVLLVETIRETILGCDALHKMPFSMRPLCVDSQYLVIVSIYRPQFRYASGTGQPHILLNFNVQPNFLQ